MNFGKKPLNFKGLFPLNVKKYLCMSKTIYVSDGRLLNT